LPLGSWLKIDPWDDSVHMLNATRYAPVSARDKIPFEVTPIFYKLKRYDAGVISSAATASAQPPSGESPVTSGNAQPAPPPLTNPRP